MDLNEARARAELIDPQLERAGWNLSDRSQVRFEVPVGHYDPSPWNGFTDYSLYERSGYVVGVVEAKRTARSPREGQEQLRQYVDEIAASQPFAPFGFMANGLHSYFWEVGEAHPRLVAGFFSPSDLERLRFIRANRTRPSDQEIRNTIVDRPYQHEAIRRVAEAFEDGRRRALIVMATGTGKTRTAMGLIDVLLRSSWARRVLFLADRDTLVEQALADGFKAHLPDEPRERVVTATLDMTKSLYVATLQTMARAYDRFSPAFFDVVVFDEAHRSIFNRFSEVIEYFDARMVGLTATPAAFIDRDSFRVFECEDRTPTFLYTYEQAIAEKRLVDFRLYQAQTGFQRNGIRGADLSQEDRDALVEQGIDPDGLDYAGTDLEVAVSNRDTLRRQWEEIMDVCIKDQGGNLPGKSIVFALSKEHAERLRDVFEEMYPEHLDVLQVIHHGVERVHDGSYGDGLISKFKKSDKPRIAASVDMLDTGVDVPEVVNLIFMKPVHSRIKLWQMIGRGTRNQEACRRLDWLPNGQKTGFLIIDFWQNDFGRQAEDRAPLEIPLFVRLFNTRLDLIAATLGNREGDVHIQATRAAREQLARCPVESFSIRKVWPDVSRAWDAEFWDFLTEDKLEFLRLKVAPLLRLVPDIDVAGETFVHKVERLKLQILASQAAPDLLESIATDVSLLPRHVRNDARWEKSVRLALSQDLRLATPADLTKLAQDLGPEMRNKRRSENSFLNLDLPDFIAGNGFILVDPGGPPVHVDEYRRRVEQRVHDVVDRHPAIAAIRNGGEPTDEQLIDLERLLHRELSTPAIGLDQKRAREAYGLKLDRRLGFLGVARHILELDALPDYEAVIVRAFQELITTRNYNGDQIRFLRAVQDVFMTRGRLTQADLYQPPMTAFGRNAADRFFSPIEIDSIVALTDRLAA